MVSHQLAQLWLPSDIFQVWLAFTDFMNIYIYHMHSGNLADPVVDANNNVEKN